VTNRRIDITMLRLAPVTRIMISDFRELLSSVVIEMTSTGKNFLSKANSIPENQKNRIISGSQSLVMKKETLLRHKKELLGTVARNNLATIQSRVTGYDNTLKILDPENVLKRGYTITSIKGKIIKNGKSLKKGDVIDTKFSDGTVSSRVVKEA